jgi:photosynthetic reaction center cytochrome c subunit
MRYLPYVAVAGAAAVGAFLLIYPTWDRPPLVAADYGPAASQLVVLTNPRRPPPYDEVPRPLPAVATGGAPLAKDVYKNVQVLGDIPAPEFDRLMVAITQWVSPKQGCGFCHNLKPGPDGVVNYADDAMYTDKVARRMIQMTMKINTDWGNHVAPSGVVCYSCHRGENVPPRVWYKQPEPEHSGILGKPRNWQTNARVIRDFFPTESNQQWLVDDDDANLESNAALVGERGSGVGTERDAEHLYIMMMQWSDALGANCNLCHNSRAFFSWKESSPYRVDGLWGQYMTQDINKNFLIPLATVFPREMLGQMGDTAKVECGTCHIGHQKPLGGYDIISHYPALAPKGVSAGPDQGLRDIMRPTTIIGPAYDPTAKLVDVSVPAWPKAEQAASGAVPAVKGAPVGPAVVTPTGQQTGVTPAKIDAPVSTSTAAAPEPITKGQAPDSGRPSTAPADPATGRAP